jgi:hypothetical protein
VRVEGEGRRAGLSEKEIGRELSSMRESRLTLSRFQSLQNRDVKPSAIEFPRKKGLPYMEISSKVKELFVCMAFRKSSLSIMTFQLTDTLASFFRFARLTTTSRSSSSRSSSRSSGSSFSSFLPLLSLLQSLADRSSCLCLVYDIVGRELSSPTTSSWIRLRARSTRPPWRSPRRSTTMPPSRCATLSEMR